LHTLNKYPALCGVPALGGAAGERGDGSGLQDGVRPAAEAERDELGEGRGASGPGPARGAVERRLGRGLCPGAGGGRASPSEGAAATTPKKGRKSRIIPTVRGPHPSDHSICAGIVPRREGKTGTLGLGFPPRVPLHHGEVEGALTRRN